MQGTGSSGPATLAGSIVGVGNTTAPATPADTTGNATEATGTKGRKAGEHKVYFAPVLGGGADAEDVKNPEGEKFIAEGAKRARAKAAEMMDVDAATKSPKSGAKGRKGVKGKGRAKK